MEIKKKVFKYTHTFILSILLGGSKVEVSVLALLFPRLRPEDQYDDLAALGRPTPSNIHVFSVVDIFLELFTFYLYCST